MCRLKESLEHSDTDWMVIRRDIEKLIEVSGVDFVDVRYREHTKC
jgi:hypothetical protein